MNTNQILNLVQDIAKKTIPTPADYTRKYVFIADRTNNAKRREYGLFLSSWKENGGGDYMDKVLLTASTPKQLLKAVQELKKDCKSCKP